MAIFRIPGPCGVEWDGNPLGVTRQGVTIRIRHSLAPIMDDAHGASPAAFISTGKSAIVTLEALDMGLFKAAWDSLLNLYAVGTLASAVSGQLDIYERNSDTPDWTAEQATCIDPSIIELRSTQELRLDVSFLITPTPYGESGYHRLFSAYRLT